MKSLNLFFGGWNQAELNALSEKVICTGAIDAYFDFKLDTLEYRSVRFETELLDILNFQGNAAVNYTDSGIWGFMFTAPYYSVSILFKIYDWNGNL